MGCRCGVIACVVLLFAGGVSAQTPGALTGKTIWITTTGGEVLQGTVAADSAGAITLRAGELTTTIPRSDVRRIEARDSVDDGVIRGTIAGAIVGAGGSGFMVYATCEVRNCAFYTVKIGLVGGAMGAAVGALAGALVDAAIPGRQVLFERQTLSIAPVVTHSSQSVSLRVRW